MVGAALANTDGTPWAIAQCDGNTLYIGSVLEQLDPALCVYVLSHETMHRILFRMLGGYSSNQLDLMFDRPMKCLDGRTLEEYLIDCICEANVPGPPD